MKRCQSEPGSSSQTTGSTEENGFIFFDDSDEEKLEVDCAQIPEPKSGWIEKLKKAGSALTNMQPASSKDNIKKKLWSTWNSLKYSGKWMSDRTGEYDGNGQIILLGRFYNPDVESHSDIFSFANFVMDYYSRIWITYRTHMDPFHDTQYTTDCGWGCMIRTTQMMVAQAILISRLGRDWRSTRIREKFIPPEVSIAYIPSSDDEEELHLQIIRLFEDCPSSSLGIHKLMSFAYDDLGAKAIGRWYSPSESISLMRKAIMLSTSPLTSDLAILMCVDGLLKISDVEITSRNWTKSLLVVVTVRLGTTVANPIYLDHLKHIFALPTCVGIVGGRPEHSLYFIGYHKEQIIYLDPHVARSYTPIPQSLSEAREIVDECNDPNKKKKHEPQNLYHCKYRSMMPYSSIDPSCAIGFLFRTQEEFQTSFHILNLNQVVDIDKGLGEGTKRTSDPLFAVLLSDMPSYTYDGAAASSEEQLQANEHGFEIL